MRAVNLLPRDEQPRSFAAMRGVALRRRRWRRARHRGAGVALHDRRTAVRSQQQNAERDALNAQLAALPHAAVDQQESDDQRWRSRGEGRRASPRSSAALSTRVAWDRVLSEISLVLPEDVWLTSLTSAAGADGRRQHDRRRRRRLGPRA